MRIKEDKNILYNTELDSRGYFVKTQHFDSIRNLYYLVRYFPMRTRGKFKDVKIDNNKITRFEIT